MHIQPTRSATAGYYAKIVDVADLARALLELAAGSSSGLRLRR
jgi:hypothetical protein